MRRKWTDYIRFTRVNLRWSKGQIQGLSTDELIFERELFTFYTALMMTVVVFMSWQSFQILTELRLFYWVLALFALVFWKSRSMISLMNRELHSRSLSG